MREGRPVWSVALFTVEHRKDADPDIPILKQAKAEYAKLQ